MKRKVFILILVAALFMLSACTTQPTAGPITTGSGSTSTIPEEEPPKEVTIVFCQASPNLPDLNKVVAEINKRIEPSINTKIKIIGIPVSNYAQQIKLMLTSEELMDLLMTGSLPFLDYTAQATSNQLLALDDLLQQYGQGILEASGDFLVAGKINGKLYGVECVADEAAGVVFAARTDVIEQNNIDLSKVTKLTDLTDVFAQLKAAGVDQEMGLFNPSTAADTGMETSMGAMGADPLGNSFYFTGVLMDPQDITQPVVNFYETEECAEVFRLAREWNQAGYIMPGIVANKETPQTLIMSGALLSYLQSSHPATQSQLNVQCGTHMTLVEVRKPLSTTDRVIPFMWAIPSYSKVPVNAMKFLNLLYSDADISNLINWGIEGTHYVKNDDGSISYPPGIDATTSTYPMNFSFAWGNQLLTHIMKGEDQQMWEKMRAFNDSSTKSKALGFSFDLSSVNTEYAACLNIYQQYAKALGVGSVDPDTVLPEFISKLKAAGVDKIVQEKQRQLDTFIQVNNVH
ncbi:MAG: ABC transporter substrate-binding protein [Saccharofermentanales bacterium]|mgnify:CR=1 FL=1|jgi:putative aldouronate transport system substrate-binding protein